jgi:hypothetical protein
MFDGMSDEEREQAMSQLLGMGSIDAKSTRTEESAGRSSAVSGTSFAA